MVSRRMRSWTTIAQNASEVETCWSYGDDDVSSFSGWLVSKATGSSNTVGYDSLKVRDNGSVAPLRVQRRSRICAVWLAVERVGS